MPANLEFALAGFYNGLGLLLCLERTAGQKSQTANQ